MNKKLLSKKTIKLRSPYKFDRIQLSVFIIIFAILGTVFTFRSRAADIVSQSTIKLSTGQSIRLGQSTDDLVKQIGPDLAVLIKGRLYQYPALIDKQAEVLIAVDQNKIIAFKVLSGKDNRYGSLGVGTTIGEGTKKIGTGWQAIPSSPYQLPLKGLQTKHDESTIYYLTDPCQEETGPNQKINSIVLVKTGAEANVSQLLDPMCRSRDAKALKIGGQQ